MPGQWIQYYGYYSILDICNGLGPSTTADTHTYWIEDKFNSHRHRKAAIRTSKRRYVCSSFNVSWIELKHKLFGILVDSVVDSIVNRRTNTHFLNDHHHHSNLFILLFFAFALPMHLRMSQYPNSLVSSASCSAHSHFRFNEHKNAITLSFRLYSLQTLFVRAVTRIHLYIACRTLEMCNWQTAWL